jgi:hypothetical protein
MEWQYAIASLPTPRNSGRRSKKASTDGCPDFKNASLNSTNSSGALRQLSNRIAVAFVDENSSQIDRFNPMAVGNPYG